MWPSPDTHRKHIKDCCFVLGRCLLFMNSGNKVSFQYSKIHPTRCNVTQFILSGNCSTSFSWYLHPSSGAQTTVSIASDICHTVTAACHYYGRVGTGLKVPWVAYATPCMSWNQFQLIHDTSRQRHWCILPDAVKTVKCSWWWEKTSPEICRACYE
jgi:hypothetical protein